MTGVALRGLHYNLYVPSSSWGQPPLVVVHGTGRRATRAFEAFLPAALSLGLPLLTPRFSRVGHGAYQTLGSSASPLAAARAFDDTLADARRTGGLGPAAVHLVGFSGGAQFAHRYALLNPDRVARLSVVSAGWYTWLDPSRHFPHGLAPSEVSDGRPGDVDGFLAVPIHVLVGALDTGQDRHLRRNERLDQRQGIDRVARALAWTAHVEETARRRGVEPQISCTLLPDTGHSWDQAVNKGGLVERVLGVAPGTASEKVVLP